jgi:hypothetical protein
MNAYIYIYIYICIYTYKLDNMPEEGKELYCSISKNRILSTFIAINLHLKTLFENCWKSDLMR